MTTPLAAAVPRTAVRFLGHATHHHDSPHLVHLVRGAAEVVADGQRHALAGGETLWLATGVPHSVQTTPGAIVFGPMITREPPRRVRALGHRPELAELMLTAVAASPRATEIVPFREAIDRLLAGIDRPRFSLERPSHPVAREIADRLLAGDRWTLGATLPELAERHLSSVRQIQRLFGDETGQAFARWRTRARLNLALAELAGGAPPARAARAAGYATRDGLLRALARETGRPYADIARDPLGTSGEPAAGC